MAKLVAYYRVSTQRQGQSGLSLDAQRAAVARHAQTAGLTIVAEYTEVESGRTPDRPQLRLALAKARGIGGQVVVAKLDRLARDVRLILELADAGVPLLLLDLPALSSADPIVGRLLLTLLAAVAEFEARRIGQRVREALCRAKSRGVKLGRSDPRCPVRPFGDPQRQGEYARAGLLKRRQMAAAHRAQIGPIARGMRESGLSLSEVASALNEQGHRTRRGGEWTAGLVHSLLTKK